MKKTLHAFAILCIALSSMPARAHRAIDLFNFDSTSGEVPGAGVITDKNGNVFGTTSFGGSGQCSCGTVYELSPPSGSGSWSLSVLYNFQGGQDGGYPGAPIALGRNGELYGYTSYKSYSTVFALTPPAGGAGNWTFQILYVFSNGKDGNLEYAYAPLIIHGNALYGIASGGSNACGQQGNGCGSLFRLSPPKSGTGSWKLKTLYAFAGGSTSGIPSSIAGPDRQGAYYVSTIEGNGAVAQLLPAQGTWTENVLTTFGGGNDGSYPGSLVLSSDGNVYGIAAARKGGLAFGLVNTQSGWMRTNIANIGHGYYGPNSLSAGENGTLIGVIEGDFDFFAGNVFQLSQSNSTWTYTQLWNFNRSPDRNPLNVVTGLDKHLFGVLNGGDSTNGSVFEVK